MKKLLALLASLGICFSGCQKQPEKNTVVILLGPPGAGKGTQALEISNRLKLPHISTGDLFRENLSKSTEIGKKAKTYMDSGKLVPDEIVLEMLFQRIAKEDCKQGYILDGFPRTIEQAQAFDKKLAKAKIIPLVINIDTPDSALVERITGRLSCKDCGAPYHKKFNPPKQMGKCDKCGGALTQRKDDTEALLKERLKAYHEQTEPLIQYYKKRGSSFYDVDGQKSKEEVLEAILKIIKKKK